jgi:hypothetical protein
MGKSLRVIDRLTVASPCPAKWDQMDGDDHARFCHQCSKHVYNFQSMSEQEILNMLASRDEVCGRFYRRSDGTILTADCPVGVSRRRRFARKVAMNVAAMASLAITAVTFGAIKPASESWGGGFSETSPMRFLARWMGDRSHTRMIMGMVSGPTATKYGHGLFGPAPATPAGDGCDVRDNILLPADDSSTGQTAK